MSEFKGSKAFSLPLIFLIPCSSLQVTLPHADPPVLLKANTSFPVSIVKSLYQFWSGPLSKTTMARRWNMPIGQVWVTWSTPLDSLSCT